MTKVWRGGRKHALISGLFTFYSTLFEMLGAHAVACIST